METFLHFEPNGLLKKQLLCISNKIKISKSIDYQSS
ncbi:MAG: hypothetical protein RL329_102 [Bacteroidota bacterium]